MKRWYLHNLSTGRAWLAEGEFRVGRSMITLAGDALLSREHFSVKVTGPDEIWIEDLGSFNGTYLNGTPLKPGEPARAVLGDEIRAGAQAFKLYPSAVMPRGHAGLGPAIRDTLMNARGSKITQRFILGAIALYLILRGVGMEIPLPPMLQGNLFGN